jgi:hypothetical protein
VLFQLLHFLRACCVNDEDADSVKADKNAAQDLIMDQVLPITQKLLRSFDPATVDAATGDNALHEMCRLFSLGRAHGWPYKLVKLLISRGVSVHARNHAGRTSLLQRGGTCNSAIHRSTDGMRLLLAHGADLNAQDGDGNGVLHLMILCGAAAEARLEDLLGGGGVAHFDYTLRNNAGQTAADLTAIRLAEQADSGADSPERRIHRLLMTQVAMWAKHARPLLLRCLESALPVADVAKLALGYVDGSGLSFVKAAEEGESDGEAEPVAAAAAQS